MSTSSSKAHATLAIPPSILPGCFLKVGWKSSFPTIVSCSSRMKSGPLPSGGSNNCRPATCIGCSRDSTMTNTSGRAAGKVAFITGAARGQGREHAVRLAEEGADIIAVDVCGDIDGVGYPGPSETDLADTATLVEKSGRRIVGAKADVRDLDGLRAALEQGVATLGALDIVVANAGISGTPAPAALIEQSAWQ